MKNLFIGIDFSKEKYCCPIKLFRAGQKKSGLAPIAGVSPFGLLLLLPQNNQPWAKVIILADSNNKKQTAIGGKTRLRSIASLPRVDGSAMI